MNKQKTNKEIKDSRNGWMIVAIAAMLFFVFMFVMILILGNQKDKLQSENEKLKEQITIWTFEVTCLEEYADTTISWHGVANYTSYEDYQNALNSIPENCVVIK